MEIRLSRSDYTVRKQRIVVRARVFVGVYVGGLLALRMTLSEKGADCNFIFSTPRTSFFLCCLVGIYPIAFKQLWYVGCCPVLFGGVTPTVL